MAITDNTQKINQLLEAINNLPAAGSGDPVVQPLEITPSESEQEFNASGIDGYKPVTVDAISKAYVGSNVPRKAAEEIKPGTTSREIAAGTYLTGKQTILGDADLVAGNIKKGVTIFDVLGTYEGESTGGGLPTGVSKLATGVYTPTSNDAGDFTVTHNFGEMPTFMVLMLCEDTGTAMLGSQTKIIQFQSPKSIRASNNALNLMRGAEIRIGTSGSVTTGGLSDSSNAYATATTAIFKGNSTYPLLAGKSYQWVVAVLSNVAK